MLCYDIRSKWPVVLFRYWMKFLMMMMTMKFRYSTAFLIWFSLFLYLPFILFRRPGEESDRESYRDTSSDASSDLDYGKSLKSSNNGAWSWNSSSEINMPRMDREYAREKSSISQEGFSSDDGDSSNNSCDCLIFEFFEQNPPYNRQPLTDKACIRFHFLYSRFMFLHAWWVSIIAFDNIGS